MTDDLTMEKAFAEAIRILNGNGRAWVQFQFELDNQFPETPCKADKGGFGRQVALFMLVPYGMSERAAKVIQAAHDAVKCVKEVNHV